MWTSLVSTIKVVNNVLFDEFKQKFDHEVNQKLKIQLEAEKDFYNKLLLTQQQTRLHCLQI